MLGLGNLGTAVGQPRRSSATSTKRPRVHSCRLPESSSSANNSTPTVVEVLPTAITRATSSTSCPWRTGVWKSTLSEHAVTTVERQQWVSRRTIECLIISGGIQTFTKGGGILSQSAEVGHGQGLVLNCRQSREPERERIRRVVRQIRSAANSGTRDHGNWIGSRCSQENTCFAFERADAKSL